MTEISTYKSSQKSPRSHEALLSHPLKKIIKAEKKNVFSFDPSNPPSKKTSTQSSLSEPLQPHHFGSDSYDHHVVISRDTSLRSSELPNFLPLSELINR